MTRVELAPDAIQDLLEIWDYVWLSSASDEIADRFVERLRERCLRLAEAPHLGRLRPEVEEGLRSLPCGMYLILYRERDAVIEVSRILHGMKDLHRSLGDHPD